MQKDEPLVSIAIITYNQKDFLRDCIESCLMQTYTNIEIVVADDCSSDGTQEMLREYEANYPNKFILRLASKNQGITSNSNAAHFACSGKYIAWIGGDDIMFEDKISTQVDFMEKNNDCSICYHDLDVFNSNTGKSLHKFSNKNKPRQGEAKVAFEYGTFNGACATMVRHCDTPNNGFNESIPVASDWLYWVETLMKNDGRIYYINQVLGRYRRHSDNVTNKTQELTQNRLDHLNTCNILLSKNPELIKEYRSILSQNYFSMRHSLSYTQSILLSIRIDLKLKYFLAFGVFLITLGRKKL